MLSGLLLHITTFLTSIGLGEWFGVGAGARVGRVRAIPPAPESQVIFLSNEIDSLMALPDGSMPIQLHQVLDALNTSESLKNGGDPDRIFHTTDPLCGSCRILSKVVIGYARIGGPIDIMANLLVKICYIFVYQSITVCRGIIDQEKVRLEWILRNSNTDADEVCALVLGSQDCGFFRRTPWNVILPPPDPHGSTSRVGLPSRQPNSRDVDLTPPQGQLIHNTSSDPPPIKSEEQQIKPQQTQQRQDFLQEQKIKDQEGSSTISTDRIGIGSGKPVLKVLHLTDPHFDPDYRIGSNAVCEGPLCCNSDSGSPRKPSDAAGKWGDYRNCDSPRWLLQHMLHHIVTTHPDIDYVICTGDFVPHHIWKITQRENMKITAEMSEIFSGFFPNVPIYGSIGNHESFPRDSFPPPESPEVWQRFGNQWLYDSISEQWSRMMKEPVPPTARKAGYYSILARPGFRIISMNTNFCYRLNWWLLYKSVDPGLLLRWLVRELQMAEAKGELVHLISHIPPLYSDCYSQWSHQFSRIVSRYAHIIRGQFYGHSHFDEFRIHYDVKAPNNPIGVEYITPNNGPFHDLNPSYRIFYIDGDHPDTTRNVLDHETWVMNLTHANAYDAPHWYKLYSARDDLQLPSLDPRHWDNLVKRMAQDPQLFARYYRYKVHDSDSLLSKGCDADCRRKTLCSIVDGDKLMPQKCRPSG